MQDRGQRAPQADHIVLQRDDASVEAVAFSAPHQLRPPVPHLVGRHGRRHRCLWSFDRRPVDRLTSTPLVPHCVYPAPPPGLELVGCEAKLVVHHHARGLHRVRVPVRCHPIGRLRVPDRPVSSLSSDRGGRIRLVMARHGVAVRAGGVGGDHGRAIPDLVVGLA